MTTDIFLAICGEKNNNRTEEIMPPKDLQKADEAYIIELFTLAENQIAEIKQLKAKIAAQDRLIEKMKIT